MHKGCITCQDNMYRGCTTCPDYVKRLYYLSGLCTKALLPVRTMCKGCTTVPVQTMCNGCTTLPDYVQRLCYLSGLCPKAVLPVRTVYKGCIACPDYVQRLYYLSGLCTKAVLPVRAQPLYYLSGLCKKAVLPVRTTVCTKTLLPVRTLYKGFITCPDYVDWLPLAGWHPNDYLVSVEAEHLSRVAEHIHTYKPFTKIQKTTGEIIIFSQ